MFELREFLMRFYDGILDLLIDIGSTLARCLGLITELFQLVDALTYRRVIGRLLQCFSGLIGSLIQLLNMALDIAWQAVTRALASPTGLLNRLLDLTDSLLYFIGLHHDRTPV